MLTLLPDDPKAAQDIVALRNALTRSQEERDQWRRAYLSLHSRIVRLNLLQSLEVELRSEAS